MGIGARVVLISGCQDNRVSLDGDPEWPVYRPQLLKVWDNSEFSSGACASSTRASCKQIKFWQSPNYFKVGKSNSAFERQRPFTI